jgi:hypothetical protein
MSDSEPADETVSRSKELIEAGSDMAGAAAGGAVGLLGGPLGVVGGAVAGVAVTRVLMRVGSELHERLLGPRQRVRVGAAFAFAADEIQSELNAGAIPRQDGFFESDGEHRPKADELLEGVLLHAANAFEERKVKHLGWLYAGFAFDPTISPAYANLLLRLADRMTYRELVILALLGTDEHEHALASLDVATSEGSARRTDSIVAELTDLGQMGVIGILQVDDGTIVAPQATIGGGNFRNLPLAKTRPTSLGRDLYRLMQLDRVPREDLQEVTRELGGDPGFVFPSEAPEADDG